MVKLKAKKVLKAVDEDIAQVPNAWIVPEKAVIQPLTQEFGNGDLNILRDKLNELIASNS